MCESMQLQRQSFDVQFLQDIIDQNNLSLKVSSWGEADTQSLVYGERRIIEWLNHYPIYCQRKHSFHLGLQRVEAAHESIKIAVYDSWVGKIHIVQIEEGVAADNMTSLSDRLMALVSYVALYFYSGYPESVGVYVIDPPRAFVSHYGMYGFTVLDNNALQVMFSTFESLFECQQYFLFEMRLDEEVILL